jgi:hypothetical protein
MMKLLDLNPARSEKRRYEIEARERYAPTNQSLRNAR